MAEETARFDVKARRNRRLAEIILPTGKITAKRLTLTSMVMDGLIPTPLLRAVEKLIGEGVAPDRFMLAMQDEERQGLMVMLRKHALAVVIDPVLVEEDDNDSAHLPVRLLDVEELMQIWTETTIGPSTEVTPAKAEEFRERAPGVAPDVLPLGPSLQPAPKLVARSVELKTG